MSEQTKVLLQNRGAFGQVTTDSVGLQSNRPDPRRELSEVALYRLAFPARFEAAMADCVIWVSSPAFITSIVGHALVGGLVSFNAVSFVVIILTIPALLWGLWLKQNCDGFESITGIRVVLLLLGLLLGTLPFIL